MNAADEHTAWLAVLLTITDLALLPETAPRRMIDRRIQDAMKTPVPASLDGVYDTCEAACASGNKLDQLDIAARSILNLMWDVDSEDHDIHTWDISKLTDLVCLQPNDIRDIVMCMIVLHNAINVRTDNVAVIDISALANVQATLCHHIEVCNCTAQETSACPFFEFYSVECCKIIPLITRPENEFSLIVTCAKIHSSLVRLFFAILRNQAVPVAMSDNESA
jgi:hypothetical protein